MKKEKQITRKKRFSKADTFLPYKELSKKKFLHNINLIFNDICVSEPKETDTSIHTHTQTKIKPYFVDEKYKM